MKRKREKGIKEAAEVGVAAATAVSDKVVLASRETRKKKTRKPEDDSSVSLVKETLSLKKKKVMEAMHVLCEFVKRKSEKAPDLMFDLADVPVRVAFELRLMPSAGQPQPLPLDIPHPLYSRPNVDVCLFVEKSQKEWKRLVEAKKIENVKKVIDIEKLRRTYKNHNDKRQLSKAFDLFLCDETIKHRMLGMLGNHFHRKFPIPVDLSKNPEEAIERALSKTYYRISQGPLTAVPIGSCDMELEDLASNAIAVSSALVEKVKLMDPPNVVDGIFVVSTDTPALPIFRAGRVTIPKIEEEE